MVSPTQSRTNKRSSAEGGQSTHATEKEYVDADAAQLAHLGHAQALERNFSLVGAASLCMCLLATWEAISAVISAALTSGGAPCLFYN